MTSNRATRITRATCVAGLTLALLLGAAAANAQSREGRWEFTLGGLYQGGSNLTFEGGSTVKTDSDFGFVLTTGYNFSESLAMALGFRWNSVGYDANVVKEGGGIQHVSGSYDAWGMSLNMVLNLSEGPITPFVGAGVGWTWIDTNVPNGIPSDVCWWDPWYGYICTTTYPTKVVDAFSYQALAGLRFALTPTSFLRLTYASQWESFDKATGTPRFDALGLEIGWMF